MFYVELGLQPDPNNIPLYQNLQQPESYDVLTKDDGYGISSTIQERQITYLTKAEPEAVYAYYKTSMPGYGWLVMEGSNPFFPGGLTFKYSVANGDRVGYGANVNITVEAMETGQNKVQLRIRGNMFRDWNP